jgi:hypothetical protein
VLAVLLSALILIITFYATLPFVSQESEHLLLLDELIPEDGNWDYSLSVEPGDLVVIDITADAQVEVQLGTYQSSGAIFYSIGYGSRRYYELGEGRFLLSIRPGIPSGDRNVHVEITRFFEDLTDNTDALDTSPWFLLLCFATLVVDVFVVRKRSGDLAVVQHLGLVARLASIMLFPIGLEVSESIISYDSAILGLDFPVTDGQVLQWWIAGISEVLMVFVLCLPGVFFNLRFKHIQDESKIVQFGGLAAAITIAISLVPYASFRGVHIVHLWENLLGLTLALFVFIPIIHHFATRRATRLLPTQVSRRKRQLAMSILLLSFLLPFGWQWVVLPSYSHSYTLWAPLWTVTQTGQLSTGVIYNLSSPLELFDIYLGLGASRGPMHTACSASCSPGYH